MSKTNIHEEFDYQHEGDPHGPEEADFVESNQFQRGLDKED